MKTALHAVHKSVIPSERSEAMGVEEPALRCRTIRQVQQCFRNWLSRNSNWSDRAVERQTSYGVGKHVSSMVFGVPANEFPSDPWEATTGDVRRLATPCPLCKSVDLAERQYGLFASQAAARATEELKDFFWLFRAREWKELGPVHTTRAVAPGADFFEFKE
jgi:hypothetical protein